MMILFQPILQLIFPICLFHIVQVFCGNSIGIEHSGRTVDQIFKYDFNIPLKKGNVLIWKISGSREPFTPLHHNGVNAQFGSKDTYLLLTQKPLSSFTVHYWLGKYSSVFYRKDAAMYAVLLANFFEAQHWVNITREIEGMETDSFQHTIKMFTGHGTPRRESDEYALNLDVHFPSPRPNLYVVRGKRYSRIKKIPLSMGIKWLMGKDTCLILEVEYKVENMLPVNVYCDAETNKNHIRRSKAFAIKFYGYTTISDVLLRQEFEAVTYTYEIKNDKHSNDFKQFLELLEDNRFYNPNEVDNSGDHLKNGADFVKDRDQDISLFDVTSDGLKNNHTRPIHTDVFQCYNSMGHVLDTKSVAGVFLIFAVSKKIQDRVKAITLAEEYMEDKYPFSSGKIIRMRIATSGLRSHILDCGINMSNFPSPLMRSLPDYELRQ